MQAERNNLADELRKSKNECTDLESAYTKVSADSVRAAKVFEAEHLQKKTQELDALRFELARCAFPSAHPENSWGFVHPRGWGGGGGGVDRGALLHEVSLQRSSSLHRVPMHHRSKIEFMPGQ